MLLYLIQHAEAKKEEEDPLRGLTDKGFQDTKKSAAYAADLRLRASKIFHSGKTRAMQTAQVLAEHLKCENISETDGLAPMDDPQIWFERISKMNEDIMLVGHLPHLANLASLILCGDKDKNIVNFKMAGIVCLKRFDDSKWSVECLPAGRQG